MKGSGEFCILMRPVGDRGGIDDGGASAPITRKKRGDDRRRGTKE